MQLSNANKRIRQLEAEVEILRTAATLFGENRSAPKGFTRWIDSLVDVGHPVEVCCRLLGVSSPGYYMYKTRPMSPTRMRRQRLTGLIREVHTASRQTYGPAGCMRSSRTVWTSWSVRTSSPNS